ncbi:MAG: hypothetical protein A3A43_01410 [Candidatus Liptonbacteria bacterium RIFCSPLOWO2_01_FULL_56_20]|uniref:Uncharacterized protein n=1 Tax=Candidatus Liptonbacteria bacterium RIFCSPLOWO2_01_FULL_56_20 TaxID=1798652 RepID=A0A1G2CM22_9BACT|nr:MAG: hypothetical protein UY96_C0008G0005 [Parcubacteria group bacterium GW2011_GWB1_56_8]OGY98035.1 MAG: hypothetical protein A2681_02255 [Candidatus Liptonbacteria bacterium RIFCSPHIGHO2_01_FULL_56_18b]OGZ01691.1 MAG: hypothetical protein A3A43_01410 [Candidatus Liptonbacteria bacterium RIFCSPLOWO2_01_FULL_56_20]
MAIRFRGRWDPILPDIQESVREGEQIDVILTRKEFARLQTERGELELLRSRISATPCRLEFQEFALIDEDREEIAPILTVTPCF